MVVSKSKLQLKKIKRCLLLLTTIFCRHTFPIFLNASASLIVMPCVPRTFSIRSCLTHCKLTSQLVPVTALARTDFFLGESAVCAPACFLSAPWPAGTGPQTPRLNPSGRTRGRSTTCVRSSLRLLRAVWYPLLFFARKVRATRWWVERQVQVKPHQKKKHKVGGRFGRNQGQALRVLKKKFWCVDFLGDKIFSSKTLLPSAPPPGQSAFFFFCFFLLKSICYEVLHHRRKPRVENHQSETWAGGSIPGRLQRENPL